MLIVSTVFSYLPAVMFAAGVVFALVTIRRQPRRSTRALIGFAVLFVGYVALRTYQLLAIGGLAAAGTTYFISRVGYLVIFAAGLALLVSALFAAAPPRAGAHATQPGWGPPQGSHPQPGPPGSAGGSW